ncbi:TetR family transcriptional regulator [Parvibaculum sedimenti]|uniref:TetR family transcriptional regulator n=1 Tax=Parvibaculum sedimenti TaxID=2608632 RepID=A0A6N6VKB3_9HYPH|nr:TetR/AcrR family transcriptional regulator [Parvibaculum sedimenti]KAB7739737.1 TetR family transcriptional regulator [Parvibaculum sedimenti]
MTNEEKRGPGRPRVLTHEERKARILDAAEALFVRQGYAATSMGDVARASSMSKKTVYDMFETKEALFSALVLSRNEFEPRLLECDTAGKTAREGLQMILQKSAELVLAPHQIALTRLVIAETAKAPELADQFYKQGIDRAEQALASQFERLCKQHDLRVDDPKEMVNFFFGAILCDELMDGLMRRPRVSNKRPLSKQISRLLDIFGPAIGLDDGARS